jgi:hypothetical protein
LRPCEQADGDLEYGATNKERRSANRSSNVNNGSEGPK